MSAAPPVLGGLRKRAIKSLGTSYKLDHLGKDSPDGKSLLNIRSIVQSELCPVKFNEGINYFWLVRTLNNAGQQDIANLVKIPLDIVIELDRNI